MRAGSRRARLRRLPAKKRRRRGSQSHEAQEQAGAVLNQRRNELSQARERATALAHELATMRARRDTVVRRLAELDRLDTALAADREREEALRGDAEARIAELDAER